MKKVAAVLSLIMLSACIYAGKVDFLPERNRVFSIWQTKKIFYYDTAGNDEYLADSKTITKDNIEKNQVLVARVGEAMAFSRTFKTDFYGVETLRVNKNAVFSSSYSPLYIKKDDKFTAFGEVDVNNQSYMLVRHNNSGDILLVNGDGEFYNHIGRIVDGRLAILDIQFFIEPHDVRLTPVFKMRSEISEAVGGFELVYKGITGNYMNFEYVTLGQNGKVDKFSFPVSQQTVEINSLKINVIDPGYNKIEYIIL